MWSAAMRSVAPASSGAGERTAGGTPGAAKQQVASGRESDGKRTVPVETKPLPFWLKECSRRSPSPPLQVPPPKNLPPKKIFPPWDFPAGSTFGLFPVTGLSRDRREIHRAISRPSRDPPPRSRDRRHSGSSDPPRVVGTTFLPSKNLPPKKIFPPWKNSGPVGGENFCMDTVGESEGDTS